MNRIWIVVANQAEAQIYAATQLKGKLSLQGSLRHAEGRALARDLVSDAPGRVHDRKGSGRHSMEPATDVKEEERRRFAREIVGQLEAAHRRGDFERLVLMAGPGFLGVLRKALAAELAKAVIKEVPRDMIGQDEQHIRMQLDQAP